MAINRKQKENLIAELNERFDRIKSSVLINYAGLKVKNLEDLRRKLKSVKIDFNIYKNNLLKIALQKRDLSLGENLLKQPIAIAFSYHDEVEPCRIINDFIKTNPEAKIIGGLLEDRLIAPENVKTLAVLPSKEELYAKVVGSCAAPIRGFVNVLAGNLRGLVSVLQQYKEKIS